jgi:SAM-dependent methyltransferase
MLPFRDESFSHVYASHVIEHFHYEGAALLLREARRILRNDGQLEIWTPNFQGMSFLKAWMSGGIDQKKFPMIFAPLTGDQDYEENVHLSQWSLKLIRAYLTAEGFRVLQARTEGDYKGLLFPLRLITKVLTNRGGVIHARASRGNDWPNIPAAVPESPSAPIPASQLAPRDFEARRLYGPPA